MVAGKHQPRCFEDGYPASGLQGLTRLIDQDRAIAQVAHGIMIGAYQRGRDHPCLTDHIVEDKLLRPLDFPEDGAGLIEQGLTLLPLRLPEIALVFVRHVLELTGLLLEPLY